MEDAAPAAALGGQTQKEAADEAAGQHDIPFYKVRGLCRGDVGGQTESESLRAQRQHAALTSELLSTA